MRCTGDKVHRQVSFSVSREHSVSWHGNDTNDVDVGSGVYFYQLKIGNHVATNNLVLIR